MLCADAADSARKAEGVILKYGREWALTLKYKKEVKANQIFLESRVKGIGTFIP